MKDSSATSKKFSSTTKRTLLTLGFIGFTVGILLSVSSNENAARVERSQELQTEEAQSTPMEKEGESVWLQFLPKTSIEKRDAIRATRQNELAEMISTFAGVKHSTVLLSDAQQRGIGQPHIVMSACVMVEPEDGALSSITLLAIRTIVADATSGLLVENVHVINSQVGAIVTGNNRVATRKNRASAARKRIEMALGLTMATVSVKMQSDNAITEYIPWFDDATPIVRVTLPNSWVQKRASQVGTEETVLASVIALAKEAVPTATVSITLVQDAVIATPLFVTKESYAKQIAIGIGLAAVLLSGFVADRRRRPQEITIIKNAESPEEEARKILELEHSLARHAIDALGGVRKVEVLRAIINSEELVEDMPVVEVKQGTQLELTKCG
ncbi:MAG TPA: hypothetical protein EYO01_01885 [Phycisphaerales bacterium]|nr:hypothetical protein [Phycisphaerales bacterium]HIN83748.1 hypothetical protein [Phycisphaerales bacterium]